MGDKKEEWDGLDRRHRFEFPRLENAEGARAFRPVNLQVNYQGL
jgi:hypothetical protein